eukprot:TRINITY_DN10553_c0_g1_i2.p1 TRINITY_DN10553_c0_g1~~TRINITY_DN10553_c0_g1_i2.p1  ORF type:complete len:522 (+),score=127.15 TRINITY_DN10553_c0_g1_i2:61-1626(+)
MKVCCLLVVSQLISLSPAAAVRVSDGDDAAAANTSDAALGKVALLSTTASADSRASAAAVLAKANDTMAKEGWMDFSGKMNQLLSLLGAKDGMEGAVKGSEDGEPKPPETVKEFKEACGGGIQPANEFHCSKERRAPCSKTGSDGRGCGRNDTRCDPMFESSNADTGQWIPCCEKNHLLNILEYVDRVLCGRVEYSIGYGTLLAAIREHDLIDWDTDIDVWVHEEDKKMTEALFKDTPEEFVTSFSQSKGEPMRVFWGAKNEIHADVFFIHSPEGNCVYDTPDTSWFKKEWLQKPFLGKCEIQGRSFPCPAKAFEVLDYLYGAHKPSEDGPSWRRRTVGNAKERALHCRDGNCTVEAHGFHCIGSDGKAAEKKEAGTKKAEDTKNVMAEVEADDKDGDETDGGGDGKAAEPADADAGEEALPVACQKAAAAREKQKSEDKKAKKTKEKKDKNTQPEEDGKNGKSEDSSLLDTDGLASRASRWIPAEPDWARNIRERATSISEQIQMEAHYLGEPASNDRML